MAEIPALTALTTASQEVEAGAGKLYGANGDLPFSFQGSAAEGGATSTATGKHRKLVVIKKTARESSPTKKRLLVTKRIADPEDVDENFEKLDKGNNSPQKLWKRSDGSILPWSVLGETALYEPAEGSTKSMAQMVNVKVRSSRSNRFWRSSGQSARSVRKQTDTEEGEVDPNQDLRTHLEGLDKLMKEALKKRELEAENEKKLLAQLPVSDRINYSKEGKMLSKWQERLQEWERIEKKIVRKVGGKTNSLLMNSIDEYRAKNEDYEIMQAAIPAQERFGPDSWMMTLRGGGERYVSIGNIFSGLMCEVSLSSRIPPMLRKPKLKSGYNEGPKLDPNPSLTMRKNALKERIETIRPYEIGEDAAQGLLFVSRDLLEWAVESTNNLLQSRLQSQIDQDRGIQDRDIENRHFGFNRPPHPSSMKILSSTNIVFSCLQGQTCYESFQFANIGSTAIRYSFSYNPRLFDRVKQPVEDIRRGRDAKTREYVLSKQRSLFHCLQAEGSLMPGETAAVTFVFCNRGSAGSFSEEWTMSLSPQTSILYTEASRDNKSAESETQAGNMPEVGAVSLLLRGQSLTVDESSYRRSVVSKFLQKSSDQRFLIDEITHCVRRVRNPVSKAQLDLRKINYFSSVNREELNKLSLIFGENVHLFFNSNRLYGFCHKFVEFVQFLDRVISRYRTLKSDYMDLTDGNDAFVLEESALYYGYSSVEEIQLMRSSIFPEATIDIFDEVTEKDISPLWDFNLSKPFGVLASSTVVIDLIIKLETAIVEIKKANEREALRQARRVAAGSDDEFDSEEDEDDEDEEDEDEAAPKPIHPLVQAKSDLESSMYAMLYQLVIEPNGLPESHARESLILALNAFEEIELSARQVAGIAESMAVTAPPNPFTSEEGVRAWKAILTEETVPIVEDPKKGGVAKKPAGKDKDKGKEAAPAAPDASQSNTFYRELHNKVASVIIDSLIDNMFCEVEKGYAEAPCPPASSDIAVLREGDFVEGGLVVVTVRGDSFFHDKSPSAFDIRKPQHFGVAKLITMASERGARGVLLVFESPGPDAVPTLRDISSLHKAVEQVSFEVAQLKEKKRPKPRKNAPPLPKIVPQKYSCVVAKTFADLELLLNKMNGVKDRRGFPVVIMEDLRSSKIVPRDLDLIDEISDDESCPLPIGLEEHQKKRADDWKKVGPKLVAMTASNGTLVNCYAGAAEALNAAIRNQLRHREVLWIDFDSATLFKIPSSSALQRCAEKLKDETRLTRVLAENVRDVASWCEVLLRSREINRHTIANVVENPDEGHEEANKAADSFSSHIRSLFLDSSHIMCAAVIGGKIRPDKFVILDKLLDSVSTLIIAGEVCLPFLELTRRVNFRKYDKMCKSYASSARELLKKARLRGVQVILPLDLADGDEVVNSDLLAQCYKNVSPGGRDEGADYQGEFKLHQMVDAEVPNSSAKGEERKDIDNYILDVGPESCALFSEILSTASFVFSWGTVGCAELSSYQAGQRAVVTASIKPAFSEDDDAGAIEKYNAKMPKYTFVVGDSNVEWWSRIADSEGEINGELARKGVVSCASRDASVVCGFLTRASSASLSMLLRRDASPAEWMYHTRPAPAQEEEADAESEEDE